jgi:L-aspartate oxidase
MTQPLISQQGQRFVFDVLVIGGGIAGLSYVLKLSQQRPHCKIALFSKTTLAESNSAQAQGGIAAVSQATDSLEKHLADTLDAGGGLTDINAARQILAYGPSAIRDLQQYQVPLDPHDLAKEGGHSERRIHHATDATGHAIIQALAASVRALSSVTIFEYHTAVNLIKQDSPDGSHVTGAYILDEKQNQIHTFLSAFVILATGGAGKVYRYTSNLDVATGDGIAMAYRIGARASNLEFYQFHPTLLYHNQKQNFLLSEALRGENAYLRNPKTLERFMQKYAPEKMELATRDIVARAIFNEIEHGEQGYVYLDMRHKDRDYLKQRFPMIFETLLSLDLDLSRDLIPVVPAAHYFCGGIATDVAGATNISRLYALGETACTGLHGANRLASNSLLENLAMASFAADKTAALLQKSWTPPKTIHDWDSESVVDIRRASQIHAHWRGLRGEMTSYAGIIRTEAGLKDLLRLISVRRVMIESYYWKHSITRDLIELRNITLVAELIVRAALARLESRGGHFREDYPNPQNPAQASFIQTGNEK